MIEIFRDISAGIAKSPSRRIFGLDPATNNIIVPIDLCTYTLDSSGGEVGPNPSLVAFLTGADIRKSSNGLSIGKVQFVDTPSAAMNVNPFVILDRSLSGIPVIDQIKPSLVNVGDLVNLDIDNTVISGRISTPLRLLSFPNDASLKIRAFTVQLSMPVGSSDSGSPIFINGTSQMLGMLLGTGNTVIACPFT
jgi:hypothetical protein